MKHDRENSPTKASEDTYSQGGHKEKRVHLNIIVPTIPRAVLSGAITKLTGKEQ